MTLRSRIKKKRKGLRNGAGARRNPTQQHIIYKTGTTISKTFSGQKYLGRIINYDARHKLYQIEYSDGDGEELDHEEVTPLLRRPYQHPRHWHNYHNNNPNNNNNHNSNTNNLNMRRRNLVQTNLLGEQMPAKDSDVFGHNYPISPGDNSTIITFQNTGPQPATSHAHKAIQTARAFKESKASVALYAETSLNELLIRPEHRFHSRMRRINKAAQSFNNNNRHLGPNSAWNARGGTAITIDSYMGSHKTKGGSGADPTGLGRWTWVRVRGKDDMHTRFISAYKPCRSEATTGTTWAQQLNYFISHSRIKDPNPRNIFDDDLQSELAAWITAGDNIVLGIDMNDDTRTSALSLALQGLGLKDAILSTHHHASPPATFNQNTNRIPIDSIWTSSSLDIIQAGYQPFDAESPSAKSDGHRMLWIEVDNTSMLGKHIPHSTQPIKTGNLDAKDPRKRKRQIKGVKKIMAKKGLFKLYKKLVRGKQACLTETDIAKRTALLQSYPAKFDTFHQAKAHVQFTVANKKQKVYAGGQPYSPKYVTIVSTMRFWERMVKLSKGCNTSRKKLKDLASSAGLRWKDVKLTERSQCETNFTLSTKIYFREKKNYAQWRREFLESLIDALADEENTERQVIENRIKREQKSRDLGWKARQITGKSAKEPVLRAITTDEHGDTIELNRQEDMIPVLAESNKSRQQQCENTPFMTAPLLQDFGYLPPEELANQVMEGTYDPPPGTCPYAVEFLATLKRHVNITSRDSVNLIVTPKEHKEGWRKMKQRTASAYGNLGFNHYITNTYDEKLNEMDTFLRNTPLIMGFVPTNWKAITDLQILKKIGNYIVDKMRCIQLMDAEYNMNNKVLGRRILAHAEASKTLSSDQHGSRKNHTAANCVLNKVLLFDIHRQKKHAGAISMNDARGCFDRIQHVAAILVLMSYGLEYTPATTLFSTLQQAEHRIKTGYGVSVPMYGNEETPIQGSGQGNGFAPTVWGLISCKMIAMMKLKGHGAKFEAALSRKLLSIVCCAYVDDSDLPQSAATRTTTGEELQIPFQDMLNRWAGALRATGGELAPEKSWCYITDFKWTGDEWDYRTIDEMPGNYTLPDNSGNTHPLKRLEVWEGSKTLGIPIAVDGTQADAYDQLFTKSHEYRTKLSRRTVEPNTAMYAFKSCFMKGLEYGMAVTSFDNKEWITIVKEAKNQTLNSSGISKGLPRAILYSPHEFNGLNFEDPYIKQSLTKLSSYIQESVKSSQTGDFFTAVREGTIQDHGFPAPLDDHWKKAELCTTPSWFDHLSSFLSTLNKDKKVLEIIEDIPVISLPRHEDQFIMKAFLASSIKKEDLPILNTMRLSIEAVSLSDIVTPDGRRITSRAWKLYGSNDLRTAMDWPRKPPSFTSTQVQLWQKSLHSVFCQPVSALTSRYLRHSCILGYWRCEQTIQEWGYRAPISGDTVYKKLGDSWQLFVPFGNSPLRSQRFRPTETYLNNLPPTATALASIHYDHDNLFIENKSVPVVQLSPPGTDDPYTTAPISIEAAFERSISNERILLDKYKMPTDDCTAIAQAIKDNTARAVSDGSFDPVTKMGTSAFVITAHKDTTLLFSGQNWSTGSKSEQSAYRSELAGIIGVLASLSVIIQRHNVTTGGITIALDGKSAMNQAKKQTPLHIAQQSFDFFQEIRNRLQALPTAITVRWRWVEGHQREAGMTMDWWAKRNDEVDASAKRFLRSCKRCKREHKPVQLWYEKWAIKLHGEKLANINSKQLYTALMRPITLKYWKNHHTFPIKDPDSVDWTSFGKALKRLPTGLQRFVTKFNSGHIGNHHMLHHRNMIPTPLCQNCSANMVEKSSHVLRCRCATAKQAFIQNVNKIVRPALTEQKTSPLLQETILSLIFKWRNYQQIRSRDYPRDRDIRAAIKDQAKIGWNNFFLGRWSFKWQTVQEKYLVRIGSRRSSSRWTTAIINKLMNTVWKIWQTRINLKFGKDGTVQRSLHDALNQAITAQFQQGETHLITRDKYLLRSYTTEALFEYNISSKQSWLNRIISAREAFAMAEPVPPTTNQRSLRDYFT